MCCMLMQAMDHSGHVPAAREDAPLEILRRRYALGEISAEQFDEMKRILGLSASAGRAEPVAELGGHLH